MSEQVEIEIIGNKLYVNGFGGCIVRLGPEFGEWNSRYGVTMQVFARHEYRKDLLPLLREKTTLDVDRIESLLDQIEDQWDLAKAGDAK